MSSVKLKFISKKISKIKWRPKSSSIFITGSYDDEENAICIWKYTLSSDKDEESDDFDPSIICTEKFTGCVTDLKVVSDELMLASSSLGSLYMYKYSDEELQCVNSWENIHRFRKGIAPVTGIAVKGQEVASIGEDERMCFFNFVTMQKIREITGQDLCSFTAVSYLRHQEIVVGNSLGLLRVWDLRSSSAGPTSTLVLSRDHMGVSSMTIHPTQTHILATGHEDGSLCMWDLRQDKHPMSLLEGHSAAVTELLFHPVNPDFLFTCSWDGSVWQWDSTTIRHHMAAHFPDTENPSSSTKSPWLNCDVDKHRLEITSIFSQPITCVNSLDINNSTLIWGTDNEALCSLRNITV